MAASADPALQHDIDHLARVLAGEAQDDSVVMVRALRVAEAAIEVQRARRARLELLRGWDLSTGQPTRIVPVESLPDFKPVIKEFQDLAQEKISKETMRQVKLLQSAATRLDRVAKVFKALEKAHPEAIITSWDDLFRQLERLERYERRARSRFDRAKGVRLHENQGNEHLSAGSILIGTDEPARCSRSGRHRAVVNQPRCPRQEPLSVQVTCTTGYADTCWSSERRVRPSAMAWAISR
jgi:hypothetical protein